MRMTGSDWAHEPTAEAAALEVEVEVEIFSAKRQKKNDHVSQSSGSSRVFFKFTIGSAASR